MTLASFFGAMLEVNYLDISCNGFSHQKTVLLNQAEVILMAITVILNIFD
jgi:hypothetical protein